MKAIDLYPSASTIIVTSLGSPIYGFVLRITVNSDSSRVRLK